MGETWRGEIAQSCRNPEQGHLFQWLTWIDETPDGGGWTQIR
jgi:hypothetical protein